MQSGGELDADRKLDTLNSLAVTHGGVSHKSQLCRADCQICVPGKLLRQLQPQPQFADVERVGLGKLVLAARVAPSRTVTLWSQARRSFRRRSWRGKSCRVSMGSSRLYLRPELGICRRTFAPVLRSSSVLLPDASFRFGNRELPANLAERSTLDVGCNHEAVSSGATCGAPSWIRSRVRAARTLRAFRNYFQWFENQLPDLEKFAIIGTTGQTGRSILPRFVPLIPLQNLA